MKIAAPTAQSSLDTCSSSAWPHPPTDDIISKNASPSIGKATAGSPLVRAILESYGKEILESATDHFLKSCRWGANPNNQRGRVGEATCQGEKSWVSGNGHYRRRYRSRPGSECRFTLKARRSRCPQATGSSCQRESASLHSLESTTFSRRVSSPKSYEHSSRPARQLSLGEGTPHCYQDAKGCSFQESRWLQHLEHIRWSGIQDALSTAAGLVGKREKGSAQRPD